MEKTPSNEGSQAERELYEDSRIREPLRAANESARFFLKVFGGFLTFVLFFAAIALSVNDELLFKDGNLHVPFLDVSIRTSDCFIVMPLILLPLHFCCLIQGGFLARKIEHYRQAFSRAFSLMFYSFHRLLSSIFRYQFMCNRTERNRAKLN